MDNIPDDGAGLLVANHAGGLWPCRRRDDVGGGPHSNITPAATCACSAPTCCSRPPALGVLARKTGADARLHRRRRAVAAQRRARRRVAGGLQGDRQAVPGALQAAALRPRRVRPARRCAPARRSCRCRSSGRRRSIPSWATSSRWPGCWACRISRLTPTFPWLGPLGLVPLPSKWYIEFGEPIETTEFGGDAADDAVTVFELTDRVRETIQSRCTDCSSNAAPCGADQAAPSRGRRRGVRPRDAAPRRAADRDATAQSPRRLRRVRAQPGRRSGRPCVRYGSRGSPSRGHGPRRAERSPGSRPTARPTSESIGRSLIESE